MSAWYNDSDPVKAEVLRQAIKAGAIAPGVVDERSIKDVKPAELLGYTQCHFFAGGGFWSLALRQAGWPDERPVWTGSCPCPAFSSAGKGGGFDDPRHLWPDWAKFFPVCRPPVCFGEQADDAIGFGWIDLVQTDLEASSYALGKIVFGAASVGAPEIRQRLYFVAESYGGDTESARMPGNARGARISQWDHVDGFSSVSALANTGRSGSQSSGLHVGTAQEQSRGDSRQQRIRVDDCPGVELGTLADPASTRHDNGRQHRGGPSSLTTRSEQPVESRALGHANGTSPARLDGERGTRQGTARGLRAGPCIAGDPVGLGIAEGAGLQISFETSGELSQAGGTPARPGSECGGPVRGFWRDAEWIPCRHPQIPGAVEWRAIKPGTFVLAHGYPNRVAALRLAGDAIVVPQATEFILAYLETERCR